MDKLWQPIVVLGVGRSGTSAVARVLIELGVSMGSRFKPPDDANPKGYWEDEELRELVNSFALGEIPERKFRLKLQSYVCNRFAEYRPWGVKHPALCENLPLWLSLVPGSRFIVCSRDTEDVKRSMRKAYAFSDEECDEVISKRRDAIFTNLADREFFQLHFEDLLSQPERAVGDIAEFVFGERRSAAVETIEKREVAGAVA